MKTNFKLLVFLGMATLMFFFAACKKSTPPTVTISDNISVTQTSANVTGEVTNEGSSSVTERGFIYGKQGESRQDTMYCGSGSGEFPTRLTGLEPNTTYNCSAFAKNDGGIGTSGKVTFTTRDHNLPIVSTSEVENVGTTTASCGGNVTDDGGAEVSERGVCWGTNHSPVATGSHATSGSGLGVFACNMNNLAANTTYYVRAYAKNVKGIAYGEDNSFTTLDFDLPEVTTTDVTNITQTSAKGGGEVTSDGGTTVTERGICWSTNHNPTISGSHANSGTGTGSFTCNITGLNAHTTYYVRAYATSSRGTAYGEEVSFNTSANPPTVSTGAVTNITTSSATGNGSIVSDGGNSVTERGFCWSTSHNPSITGTHVVAEGDANDFSAALTNLSPNTTYYVRAYATNGTGTAYGDEVQFTTLSISVPGVTTASVTNIGNTTATGGGNVVSNGGATVTERGICWSTSHDPTISGSHANSGTGTGEFTVSMTNLTPNTTYYVRAYAINNQGTAYGEEVNFKTSLTPTYTVAVSASPSNGGSVAGGGTYEQGQSCTIRATAATGYNFQKWTENGSQVSTNAAYTFTVSANRNLVAVFQAGSYTISASASPSSGGTISGAGSYNYGQNCTLRATPATGYSFVKWTKNNTQVSTNASYTFAVTASASYVAHFDQQSYNISLSASPSNGGTVSGGGVHYYGQACTVRAVANSGYTFTNWTENGSVVSTNANYNFTVTGNRTLVAHFTSNPQNYTISVSANPSNGGSVSGGGTYQQGQSCTVHATANSGYTFTNWTENGNVVSANANYTFTVTGNRTLVAQFQQQSYTISTNVNPSGSGSVTGGGTYYYGQSCTLTANANSGYTFSHWQDGNTSNPRTITVTGNATYTAYFNAQPQAPIGAINGKFTINANGNQVHFSQGNLQYRASTGTWQFAANQYDYIGNANSNISSSYSGWIDLFGWGTSGWNPGNTYYRPWDSNNSDGSLYGPPGQYNLTGSYAHSDWGVHNAISNGGNAAGQWRTLTQSEWDYVFYSRSTNSGIRYAKAQVAGVNGVILLPDDWSTSYYSLSSTNQSGASFTSNVIGSSAWTNSLQSHGAVFLPAAGSRSGTSVYVVGSYGYYWSASYNDSYGAWSVYFYDGYLHTDYFTNRYYGLSVRLVCPAE